MAILEADLAAALDRVAQLDQSNKAATAMRTSLESSLASLRTDTAAEMAERDEWIADLERDLKAARDQSDDRVAEEKKRHEAESMELRMAMAALHEQVAGMARAAEEKAGKEGQDESRDIELLKEEIESRDKEVSALKGQLELREAEVRALEGRLADNAADAEALRGQLESRDFETLKGQLEAREKEIEALKTQLESRDEAQKGEADAEVEALKDQLASTAAEIDALKGQLESRDSEVDSLLGQLGSRGAEVEALKAQLESRDSDSLASHTAEIDALKAQLESRVSEVASLTSQLASRDASSAEESRDLRETIARLEADLASAAEASRQSEADENGNLQTIQMLQQELRSMQEGHVTQLKAIQDGHVAELDALKGRLEEAARAQEAADVGEKVAQMEAEIAEVRMATWIL